MDMIHLSRNLTDAKEHIYMFLARVYEHSSTRSFPTAVSHKSDVLPILCILLIREYGTGSKVTFKEFPVWLKLCFFPEHDKPKDFWNIYWNEFWLECLRSYPKIGSITFISGYTFKNVIRDSWMPFNHFRNNAFQVSTLRSIISCQKPGHICPESKVRSHCHLVVKVRNSSKSARGLTAIVFISFVLIASYRYSIHWHNIHWDTVFISVYCHEV